MDVLKDAHALARKIFNSKGVQYWIGADLTKKTLDAVYDAMHAGAQWSLDHRAEEAEFIRYTAGALYAMVHALHLELSETPPPPERDPRVVDWYTAEDEGNSLVEPTPTSDLTFVEVGERLRALPGEREIRLHAEHMRFSAQVVGCSRHQSDVLSAAVETALSAAEASAGK